MLLKTLSLIWSMELDEQPSQVANTTDTPCSSCNTSSANIAAAESESQIEESDESESQMAMFVKDLGGILHEVRASWDKLRSLVEKLSDEKIMQYLIHHFRPGSSRTLHSHSVTKSGRTWNVSFQLQWLDQFPWLSYSSILSGGICRHCILFPEQPGRGEGLGHGSRSGVLVLIPYQSSYSKALGKVVS